MALPRCSTRPLTGATVGVPDAAIMSTPSWARPPERGAPKLSTNETGPWTGHTMPPAPTRPEPTGGGGGVAVAGGTVVVVGGAVVVVVSGTVVVVVGGAVGVVVVRPGTGRAVAGSCRGRGGTIATTRARKDLVAAMRSCTA